MGIDSEFHVHAFDSMLDFLHSTRAIPAWSKYGGCLTVETRFCPDKLKRKYFGDRRVRWKDAPLLRFMGDFSYAGIEKHEITEPGRSRVTLDADQHLAYWRSVLPYEIDVAIQTYMCALTIAYPGALLCVANTWLVDGKLIDYERCLVSLVSRLPIFWLRMECGPYLWTRIERYSGSSLKMEYLTDIATLRLRAR